MSKICDRPLGLPNGSVRAILAIGTVGAGIYLMTKQVLTFDQFLSMTGVVFAFYFGSKRNVPKVELKKDDVCSD